MNRKILFSLSMFIFLFAIFTIGNNITTQGKNTVVVDETINVIVDQWFYEFIYSNGTSITFNWDNYTTSHLTLYTGKTYLFNITNTGLYEHGMKFVNNATKASPYDYDVVVSSSPLYEYANFTNTGYYEVTCTGYGNCGQHHAQMNFYVDVVANPTSTSSSSTTSSSSSNTTSSGNVTTVVSTETSTVTDIVIVTSNVTSTQNVTVPLTQNVTRATTVSQTITQTQSLAGMSAIVTFFAFIGIIPVLRHRSKNK